MCKGTSQPKAQLRQDSSAQMQTILHRQPRDSHTDFLGQHLWWKQHLFHKCLRTALTGLKKHGDKDYQYLV